MRIVECFGLPGSGKSYLSEKLVKGLVSRGLPVFNRECIVETGLRKRNDGPLMNTVKKAPGSIWRRLVHEDTCLQEMLDCFACYPGFVSLVFQCIECTNISENHARSIIGAIARTCVEYTVSNLNTDNSNILVADEWFCHRFHTVYGNCGKEVRADVAARYTQNIPLSDIGVFIATTPERCIERMRQRNRFPEYMETMTYEEVENNINISYRNFNHLVSSLESKGMNVIRYDGVDVDPVLDKCAKLLEVV